MNPTPPHSTDAETTSAPSAEFINAISDFFETDPSDLLVELGYYQREDEAGSGSSS
ncbi:MAG: hypothetical protein M3Y28_01210 [Armatimonadota bacterium]|nr:hypothetical protein [Armatimonadota bacterium]